MFSLPSSSTFAGKSIHAVVTFTMNDQRQEFQQQNRTRIAISLFFFSHGLILSSWASRIPVIKTNLGISDAELGTLLLLMPVGQVSTMPLSARLINHFGSKNAVKYSFLLYPLILVIIGTATSYTQLAIALYFFGVVGNLSNIAVNTQGVELENILKKPMMSSFHGTWSISGFIGALIGLLLLNFNQTPLIHFSVIFLLVVSIWIFNTNFLLHVVPVKGVRKDRRSIFRYLDKTLIRLGLIGFLSMAIEGAMFDWSGVYFQDIVRAPEQLIILGYTSFVLMMATGRFLGDWLITKLGRKRLIQLCGILMSTGLIISVFYPTVVLCTIAFMVIGLGSSCSVPTVYGVAGKHKAVSAGNSLTLISTIAFLGFLMGPPMIGFISDLFDLRYSYLLLSVFGIVMIFMAGRMDILDKEKAPIE